MLEKGFVTRAEWKAHIQTHPFVAHNVWPRIRDYVPAYGYSRSEIDALFEPTAGGKKQILYGNVINLVAGVIPYGTGATGLTGATANLFYDAANQLFGVREGTPTARVHVNSVGGNIPCLNLEGGAEGELVTPDGQQLRIGHWNAGTTTFTERMKIDDAGKVYISYMSAGSVGFYGAGGEKKQDNSNFFWDDVNKRLGIALGGGAPAETLQVGGKLRLVGDDYSTIMATAAVGRQILILRGRSLLADSAGINLYGDGDSAYAGMIRMWTNNVERLEINAAGQFDFKASSLVTTGTLGCGTITVANGSSINLQEDITFIGATTENLIKIPDNLAVALDITEAGNPYLRFITTDTSESVSFHEDIFTDRWLNQASNTFVGVGVVGSGNLAHAAGGEGYYNTAFGNEALKDNTIGQQNIAVGRRALYNNTTGSYNSAVGHSALEANTTGIHNLAFGQNALDSNTTGSYNSAFGRKSLSSVNPTGAGEGVGNIGFGYKSGDNITTGSYNIIIGYDLDAPSATGNYQLNIGNLLYGNFSTGNVGINIFTWGANAVGVYAQVTGTAPSTSPADCFQMYSADIGGVAGKAGVHFRGEDNNIVSIGSGGVLMSGTARVFKCHQIANAALGKGGTKPDEIIVGNYWGWSYDINDDSVITVKLPDDWASGTDVLIYIRWAINEAYVTNSGEVRWQATWLAVPADATEAIDGAGTTDNSGDIDIPATVYGLAQTLIETIPGASLAAGDELGITIKRVAIGGGNDPTADPVVTCVGLVYTADKMGLPT